MRIQYIKHFFIIFLALTFIVSSADAKKIESSTKSSVSSSRSKSQKKKSGRCFTTLLSGDVIPCAKSPAASIVVDTKSGKVLHAEKATHQIYPASLTKVMTLYVLFEAIEKGKLHLDQHISISAKASSMPPCKLGLKAGDKIKVSDAIKAIIVKSANDIAVAAAEAVSGSEEKFAAIMTKRARDLGMNQTLFRNATGWFHPDQKTTALDLAKLAIAIKRDFPKHYHNFSNTSFVFRGNVIRGHNPVTANYHGAEGMKTGFNNPAGSNLITTASRNGKSLVGVVTGNKSRFERDNKMVSLLDKYFGVSKGKEPTNIKVAKASNQLNKKYKAKKQRLASSNKRSRSKRV